jgi:hypothetical protein
MTRHVVDGCGKLANVTCWSTASRFWHTPAISAGSRELGGLTVRKPAKSSADRAPGGPSRNGGSAEERRLRLENGQLKMALAEATVQLRMWQQGAEYTDQVPSTTSKP